MVTIISGLIQAGKSTLLQKLMGWGYTPVIEYTTRPMRKGERNHVDYHFITDEEFDRMEAEGEFAEAMHADTIYGVWKYGARKEDLKSGCIMAMGPYGLTQLLEQDIPVLSVILDISEEEAITRARSRGDDIEEVKRRYNKDKPDIDAIRDRVSMVLDARNPVEVNARFIDNRLANERVRTGEISGHYEYHMNNTTVVTAQKMTAAELKLYLGGDKGLKPYLRMKEKGMPHNPVNQIAWLLLQGSGCGFCKACRKEPCGIKDDEKCTTNIANYIRECVHAEDMCKSKGEEGV